MSGRLLVAIAVLASFVQAERAAIERGAQWKTGNPACQDSQDCLSSTAMDMVVARIGADGKPVIGCVSTAEGARRFFESEHAPKRAAEEK